MTKFQIRTRRGTNMEDVVSELALGILESIKRELDSSEVPFESYRSLEGALRANFSSCIHAYDLCGSDEICTSGIQDRTDYTRTDRIFVFESNQDLDSHLETITNEVLHSIRFLDSESADALHRRVKAGISRTLTSYMYLNTYCRNHEICRQSVSVNPWISR
jgi:hypothetical protein